MTHSSGGRGPPTPAGRSDRIRRRVQREPRARPARRGSRPRSVCSIVAPRTAAKTCREHTLGRKERLNTIFCRFFPEHTPTYGRFPVVTLCDRRRPPYDDSPHSQTPPPPVSALVRSRALWPDVVNKKTRYPDGHTSSSSSTTPPPGAV